MAQPHGSAGGEALSLAAIAKQTPCAHYTTKQKSLLARASAYIIEYIFAKVKQNGLLSECFCVRREMLCCIES